MDLWRSEDEGESFEKVCMPVEVSRSGNPPTLTLLPDGRIALVVGWRLPPYGVRAKISATEGQTWSGWILLRADAGTGDIGEFSLEQRTFLYHICTLLNTQKPFAETGYPRTVLTPSQYKSTIFTTKSIILGLF